MPRPCHAHAIILLYTDARHSRDPDACRARIYLAYSNWEQCTTSGRECDSTSGFVPFAEPPVANGGCTDGKLQLWMSLRVSCLYAVSYLGPNTPPVQTRDPIVLQLADRAPHNKLPVSHWLHLHPPLAFAPPSQTSAHNIGGCANLDVLAATWRFLTGFSFAACGRHSPKAFSIRSSPYDTARQACSTTRGACRCTTRPACCAPLVVHRTVKYPPPYTALRRRNTKICGLNLRTIPRETDVAHTVWIIIYLRDVVDCTCKSMLRPVHQETLG